MSKINLKTPNSLILDIYGIISSHSFKNDLKKFAIENLTNYINDNFGSRRFVKLINRLIEENDILIKQYPNIPLIDKNFIDVEDEKISFIKNQVESNVKFRIEKKCFGNTILFFYEDIWLKGYESGNLKAHIYEDVVNTLRHWRLEKYIKIYTLASGKSKGQYTFLKNTIGGDISYLIANCMDPSSFGKEDTKCFNAISLALRSEPEKLLYLTDNIKRMQTAKKVKFQVVLVKRFDNEVEYDKNEIEDVPVINNLNELNFIDDPNQMKSCC